MAEKERRGYRRKRLPEQPAPLKELHSNEALAAIMLGSDMIGQIEAQASALYPPPEPEDLLAGWAREYYRSRNDWFLVKIGLYVAEDLRLLGKLEDQ